MTAKQFDAALRKAIEADPRSVRQLAADAGVSEPSLHHYRHGSRGISWETAAKLLSALGFKMDRDSG
jgi:transcriptional regulator with XRE-family HTH domain